MDFDLEKLLAPVSEEDPAGPDLDYDDAERDEIRVAFDSSVSMDSSGTEQAGAEIDWAGVIRKIVAQSARTKDIWLAVYLSRAGARIGDFSAVVAGAEMLAGLLERYWDVVHPTIEELGYIGRKTPCDSLANRGQFLRFLEQTTLVKHQRLGSYSAADFDRFRRNGEAEEGYGFFRAALEDLGDQSILQALEQVRGLGAALRRADRVFAEKAVGEPSPNFELAYQTLLEIERSLGAFVSTPVEPTTDDGETVGAAEAAKPSSSARSGPIASRDDVVRAIDAICDFYRKAEPTSPIPLVLQRARAWVHLDFLGLLDDLAPDSLRDVRRVLSLRSDQD